MRIYSKLIDKLIIRIIYNIEKHSKLIRILQNIAKYCK